MDGVTVTLEPYNSKFFPVKVKWNEDRVEHWEVFDTKERALKYYTARFGQLNVIDHLNEEKEEL